MKPFRQVEVQWGRAWSHVCRPGWGQIVVVFITGAAGCFMKFAVLWYKCFWY